MPFGPEWFWDQNRPEAIAAHAQMAKDRKKLPFVARRPVTEPGALLLEPDSAATHFRLAARHLRLALTLGLAAFGIGPIRRD